MQTAYNWSSRVRETLTIGSLIVIFLSLSLPSLAQDSSQSTTAGTVASSTKHTLVVKDEGNHYKLFIFDGRTVKPATLAPGAWVRVLSVQTDDPDVRLAVVVTVAETPAPPSAATPAQPDVVPDSVRDAESAIERSVRKFHIGFQGGVGMDPEVLDVGIHAQFGPFFTKRVQFRPSVDFGFGEISKLFSINAEAIFNTGSIRGTRQSFYFGVGPQFNFTEQSASGEGVSFSDFEYSTGLNILLGMKWRSGVFTEIKTSIWAEPAPIVRLIAGYSF